MALQNANYVLTARGIAIAPASLSALPVSVCYMVYTVQGCRSPDRQATSSSPTLEDLNSESVQAVIKQSFDGKMLENEAKI